MKTWKVCTACILLTFLCLFTSVGYAAISAPVKVIGSVKTDVPYGLFITDVSYSQGSNIYNHEEGYLPYSTSVETNISRSSGTATIKYSVTVFNNTKLTYSYRDFYFQTGLDGYSGNNLLSKTASKSKISVTCSLDSVSAEEKKINPGEKKTFTVTYTIGSNVSSRTNYKTLINFRFGINVDGEREALAVVEEKFLDILNTTTTYNQLVDALDNKFDGRQEWTSNYIGNVTGSTSDDSVAVNTLFAGQLQISVGKDNMDATVLIKHENLDWNNYTGDDYTAENKNNGGIFRGYGCEMTLYLTVDPLNVANKNVPVYVVVFTCDRDWEGNMTSEWYRIGTTYAGKANVVTYDGGNGTGSFVTDNWISDAATYKLIDGYSFNINGKAYNLASYSHNIAQGTSIKNIVIDTDENAVATLQTLFNDAYRIINDRDFAGVGIDLVEEQYTRYSKLFTMDENGNHTVSSEATIAQLSPAITDLYRVVNDALVEMEELIQKQLEDQQQYQPQ